MTIVVRDGKISYSMAKCKSYSKRADFDLQSQGCYGHGNPAACSSGYMYQLQSPNDSQQRLQIPIAGSYDPWFSSSDSPFADRTLDEAGC